VRVRGDDRELRPWHYIYVYSIESRLTRSTLVGNGSLKKWVWYGAGGGVVCSTIIGGSFIAVYYSVPYPSTLLLLHSRHRSQQILEP
jgi:hypothetical protein